MHSFEADKGITAIYYLQRTRFFLVSQPACRFSSHSRDYGMRTRRRRRPAKRFFASPRSPASSTRRRPCDSSATRRCAASRDAPAGEVILTRLATH
jgi:hypothetical protein